MGAEVNTDLTRLNELLNTTQMKGRKPNLAAKNTESMAMLNGTLKLFDMFTAKSKTPIMVTNMTILKMSVCFVAEGLVILIPVFLSSFDTDYQFVQRIQPIK